MPPAVGPESESGIQTVRCVSGCGGFWDEYAINWPVVVMVVLCMMLLWWWGCGYIQRWLEKNGMLRDKKWEKSRCPRCLEHFLECFCENPIICGCHDRQLKYERQQRSRVRQLVRYARRRP